MKFAKEFGHLTFADLCAIEVRLIFELREEKPFPVLCLSSAVE